MQITARSDYAVRAVVELAAREDLSATRAEIAESQSIPSKFLETILSDLKRAGLLTSRRGTLGGYSLAVDAHSITIADIVRAVDGPLAAVRGVAPEAVQYHGAAEPLRDIWVAVRASVRLVLESTTVADLIERRLPQHVEQLLNSEGAYERR